MRASTPGITAAPLTTATAYSVEAMMTHGSANEYRSLVIIVSTPNSAATSVSALKAMQRRPARCTRSPSRSRSARSPSHGMNMAGPTNTTANRTCRTDTRVFIL